MGRAAVEPAVVHDAFCCGCRQHGLTLYRVALSRYRCEKCAQREAPHA